MTCPQQSSVALLDVGGGLRTAEGSARFLESFGVSLLVASDGNVGVGADGDVHTRDCHNLGGCILITKNANRLNLNQRVPHS